MQSALAAASAGGGVSLTVLFGRELARLFAVVRPERDLVSGAEQVASHGVAHRAESEES